jgi:pSer/pThr/pTyr-binding forkhead associated (FHA) protein
VEIRNTGQEWEVVNLGANGTYIDGKRITNAMIADGTIVRLASSGPKIQIKIESESPEQEVDESDRSFTDGRGDTRQPKGNKDTLIS